MNVAAYSRMTPMERMVDALERKKGLETWLEGTDPSWILAAILRSMLAQVETELAQLPAVEVPR